LTDPGSGSELPELVTVLRDTDGAFGDDEELAAALALSDQRMASGQVDAVDIAGNASQLSVAEPGEDGETAKRLDLAVASGDKSGQALRQARTRSCAPLRRGAEPLGAGGVVPVEPHWRVLSATVEPAASLGCAVAVRRPLTGHLE